MRSTETTDKPPAQTDNQGPGRISNKMLVNTLNYLHFQDRHIIVYLKHSRYGNLVAVKASPRPCNGETLECAWLHAGEIAKNIGIYRFAHIFVDGGEKLYHAEPELIAMDELGARFTIVENCAREVPPRKLKRHAGRHVQAEVLQNGILYDGRLADFSPGSFRVEIPLMQKTLPQCLNQDVGTTLILRNSVGMLYSSECRILRQRRGHRGMTCVLEPPAGAISRFPRKYFRSARHRLTPSPTAVFKHPLSGELMTLKIDDISGGGISLEENHVTSSLFVGLILPEIDIELSSLFRVRTRGQVVHRSLIGSDDGTVRPRCGIAFLDMEARDQAHLSNLLHQTCDSRAYVCNRVDQDALWKFFFDSGFVYPQKYAMMHRDKEKFKKTYEKLYLNYPDISRHFIYQDMGAIQAHISMLRFYDTTWLFQHHASKPGENARAGLLVLQQISQYVNDFYCQKSSQLEYVMAYFRPNNRFPARVFGGFASHLADKSGCSLDPLTYFLFEPGRKPRRLPEGYTLGETSPHDLLELQGFYAHESGGLMIEALDVASVPEGETGLNGIYKELGFHRKRYLYSLRRGPLLVAVFIVNCSDVGLNMSNILNGVQVIILEESVLDGAGLYAALSGVAPHYEEHAVPVMVYPAGFQEKLPEVPQKTYHLWVIRTSRTDSFLAFMNTLLSKSVRRVRKPGSV